ncbi:hypothetical protein HWV62_8431 [Athelia sp. TMB]|nr:hypothetical protein HWV62_8431 [Athelia sp. TMB]
MAISWFGSAVVLSLDIVILYVAQNLQSDTISVFDHKYRPLVITVLVMQLSVDLINTTSLCILLRGERTGRARTDTALNQLVVWTLETGLITSLAAVLMLIFCLVLPNTTLWVAVSIFYSKLYSNSLMASLNARSSLRTAMNDSDLTELGSSAGTAVNASSRKSEQARKASKTFQRPANGNSYRLERRDSLEFSKRTLDDGHTDNVDVADRPSANAFSPA